MQQKSVSEVVNQVVNIKTKKDKVAFLKANNSFALRTVLKGIYDPNIVFLLPSSQPPYTPSDHQENHGQLLSEARRLKIFVRGGGYDNLNQTRRESLFIQLLENVHKDDAKILVDMIQKNTYKGLTKATINEAFPGLIEEKNG